MTGTFEYEKGDKRAGAGLQRVLPLLRDLSLLLRRRLVPHPDAPLGPDRRGQARRLVRTRRRRASIGPTSISQAAKLLVDEGKAKKEDFPFGQRRLPARRPPSSSTASTTTAASPTPTSTASRSASRASRRSPARKSSPTRRDGRCGEPTHQLSNDDDRELIDTGQRLRRRRTSTTARAPRERTVARASTRSAACLTSLGLGWLVPLVRMAAGDRSSRSSPSCGDALLRAARRHRRCFSPPGARWRRRCKTSRSAPFPGPVAGLATGREPVGRPSRRARTRKRRSTHARSKRNAELVADGRVPTRSRSAPTPASRPIIDQILTSLKTVVARLPRSRR